MKNEFIPYEEALELKELGFDEPCFYVWNIDTKELFSSNSTDINGQPTNLDLIGNVSITAPLYQQAFRWFRENGYHCGIIPRYDEFHYFIKDFVNNKEYDDVYNISSYEEAELACLRKLIEIVKKQRL